MNQSILLAAGLCCFAVSGHTQGTSTFHVEPYWQTSIGYPSAVSGGLSVIAASHRSVGFRGSSVITGAVAGFDLGLGSVTAKLGWAKLLRYDAGMEGWSLDAVYLRPWVLRWGFERNANYFGPGFTFHFGYLKFSGAITANIDGDQKPVNSTVTLGIVIPFKQ